MARKPIVIKNFQNETAQSSYLGFEEIRCMDTKNRPGSIRASYSLEKESGSTIDDEIFATTMDGGGNVFGITQENTNSLFKRTESGVWSELSGFANSPIAGIGFFEDYIILIHTNGSLDASTDGVTWTNAFATASNKNNLTVPTLVASDRKLYMGAYNLVDSLAIGSSGAFDPTGSSVTDWVLTLGTLDLPPQYEIRNMVELGNNLMLGTFNSDDKSNATIFPWDKSAVSFNFPIRLKEYGIVYMIEVENLLYVCAGTKGRWYVTNGTTVNYLSEIPKTMFDLTALDLQRKFNNAVAYNEGLIYFGVSSFSKNDPNNKLGVYSLNPKNGKINFSHIISNDEIGATENEGLAITCITKVLKKVNNINRESIVVNWSYDDTPTYGGDAIGGVRYTGNKAFFVSEFLSIGLSVEENSFNKPEINLVRPLTSGDSLKVWYRRQQGGSWTLHYTEARVGFQNGFMPAINDIKDIQFKVSLNGDAELLNLILI